MALTIPSVDFLYTFWGNEADTSDEDRATVMLQLAANLLWLATGLEDDPTDSRLEMLVQLAMADMAIFLYVSREDIDEDYSPFVSERIGSYSYSKTYSKVGRTVAAGLDTGVPLFDRVVQYFLDQALYGTTGSFSGEQVFHVGYQPLGWQSMGFGPYFGGDPNRYANRAGWYSYFGNADDDEGTYGHHHRV